MPTFVVSSENAALVSRPRFDPDEDNDLVSDLLFDSFRLIESCTFSAENLTQGMVLSLMSHLKTLTTIKITNKCTDNATLRWLYLTPKTCSHLKVLSMQELVLDMTSVEDQEWSCLDQYLMLKINKKKATYSCPRVSLARETTAGPDMMLLTLPKLSRMSFQ